MPLGTTTEGINDEKESDEIQYEVSTLSKLFSPEEEDSFYETVNPSQSRSFNVIENEFQFLKDYDSSVARRCEVIDISTLNSQDIDIPNTVSCDSFESNKETDKGEVLQKTKKDLVTIKSYRDSQRSQVNSLVVHYVIPRLKFQQKTGVRATLPVPTVVLLPNSNSNVSVFPFETQKEQIERKTNNFDIVTSTIISLAIHQDMAFYYLHFSI